MTIKDIIKSVQSPNWNNLTQTDTLEILKAIDYLLEVAVVNTDTTKQELPKFAEDKIKEIEIKEQLKEPIKIVTQDLEFDEDLEEDIITNSFIESEITPEEDLLDKEDII